MAEPNAFTPEARKLIRETIAGYAAAAEIIEQERIERLRRMTVEDSKADYAALVSFHRLFKKDPDDAGIKRLEEWRLQEKIAMRRVFEGVARARGLL